jgi:hypothetical protein
MKTKILLIITVIVALMPNINFAQAPSLGTAANFALFSTNGAVNITGISHLTGNIGTNNGATTIFDNVNGTIHDQDGASGQCASDLLLAYNQLAATTPTFTYTTLMGNNDTLKAGVYNVAAASTLIADLTLDALGNSSAVFIFQIHGSFSTNADSKIKFINGAQACNVFWQVEGLVSMASGTTMRGTVIANNAAINMSTGDTLEGRALSTAGAVTVDGSMVYTPPCGIVLNGPAAPALLTTECYSIFSTDGPVSNSGVTYLTGDVGTNVGLTTNYNPLFVTGTIHPIPDGSTSQCATDLLTVYNYLNALSPNIELRFPAKFGNNLVLTPHTYVMYGATTFTDTLYLNAQGNSNAVFVIQIYGALSTSVYSKVILMNNAQSKNVFWEVNGAVNINDYSVFRGTIVANNGAIDLATGVTLDGRALTTTGAIQTIAITAVTPTTCNTTGINVLAAKNTNESVIIYPNPFSSVANIVIKDASEFNTAQLKLYNMLGAEISTITISKQVTTLEAKNLSAGIYFYKVIGNNNNVIQSGKLISE